MDILAFDKQGSDHLSYAPAAVPRGVLVVGQPDMGQRELFQSLIAQEVREGAGYAVLDMRGALLPDTLGHLPRWAVGRTDYLDFGDADRPVQFNPLDVPDDGDYTAARGSLLTALQVLFGHSWGPRMEYVLSHGINVMLAYPGATLLTLQEFLTDERFRRRVLAGVADPTARYFFDVEFAQLSERFRREAVAPIQNKIGQFILDEKVRNLVAHPKNKTPQPTAERFLMARVPQGDIGLTGGRLIAATLLAQWLQGASAGRVYIPGVHRLASPGLAAVLEEAFERRRPMVASVPSLATLEPEFRKVLLGNVDMLIAFRLGAEDADLLSRQLHPYRPDEVFRELTQLPQKQVVFRAPGRAEQGGKVARNYEAGVIPAVPSQHRPKTGAKIQEQGRQRFTVARAAFEERLNRHLWRIAERGPS